MSLTSRSLILLLALIQLRAIEVCLMIFYLIASDPDAAGTFDLGRRFSERA
jgi:hypothetical protein